MGKTKKGAKSPGYDFWSRRPLSGQGHGKKLKKLIHRIERQQNKRIAKKEKEEV